MCFIISFVITNPCVYWHLANDFFFISLVFLHGGSVANLGLITLHFTGDVCLFLVSSHCYMVRSLISLLVNLLCYFIG